MQNKYLRRYNNMVKCPKCRQWFDFGTQEELKVHVQLECSGEEWQ